MTGAPTARLYTPEVLALAASLATYPFDESLPFTGQARSQSCGSTLAMSIGLDPSGRIACLGLKPHACAIGQASAAIFAAAARGRGRDEIVASEAALSKWLSGDADLPDWPGLAAIAAARDYPARHGAILLPWRAALDALPTG